MTKIAKYYAAIAAVLLMAPAAHAGPCTHSIVRVQARVDAAIGKRADSDSWRRESLSATRNYQPTPFSLAATEGHRGQDLEVALDSLDRARDADRVGNAAVCRQELAAAKAVLR